MAWTLLALTKAIVGMARRALAHPPPSGLVSPQFRRTLLCVLPRWLGAPKHGVNRVTRVKKIYAERVVTVLEYRALFPRSAARRPPPATARPAAHTPSASCAPPSRTTISTRRRAGASPRPVETHCPPPLIRSLPCFPRTRSTAPRKRGSLKHWCVQTAHGACVHTALSCALDLPQVDVATCLRIALAECLLCRGTVSAARSPPATAAASTTESAPLFWTQFQISPAES